MGYISDVIISNNQYRVEPTLFGTTNTAAGTAQKQVTLVTEKTGKAVAPFELIPGVQIAVQFTVTNTASNPTLKVGDSTAVAIKYRGVAIAASALIADRVYAFVYTGSAWELIGDLDTNTWRGIVNNLTSDSTTESLSAAQGKELKRQIDLKTSNTGTVTKVETGAGLTGGPVTTTGTIKADLVDETKLSAAASATISSNANRIYPVALDSNGKLAVNVPWVDTNDNNKVTQTATTTNASYELLFSETADNTNRTEGARKTDSLLYNPNSKTLSIDNGTTVGTLTATNYSGKAVTAGTADSANNVAWANTNHPSTFPPSSHTHGNITNDGKIGTANAARAVVTNASNQVTVDNFAQDSPSVPSSGTTTSLEFIDTVSQGASGKITATKKKIPNVSKDTAGLAPKGAAVSTQSQSTKFLREDGSWAAPSYTTNTDQKVKQNANTENKEFSVLLKTTNDINTETGEVKFGATSDKLVTVNPNTGTLTAKTFSGALALSNITGADDLKAIEALTGTSGLLKKTAANTWALDTTAYATQTTVNGLLAAADAMIFKGTLGSGGTISAVPAYGYQIGWTYKIITATEYAGQQCEIGDLIIAIADAADGQTQVVNSHWVVVQTNIDGAVTGPASSTNGNIVLFNGDTGKLIKDSNKAISTNAPTASSTDSQVPTSKAVWDAIDALDVSNISGFGQGKTLSALTETNGKIAATFQDIKITKSQVSDFTHTHNYAGSASAGGAATYATTTTNNADALYLVGVKNGEVTSLLHNTHVMVKGNDLVMADGAIYFGKTATNKAILAYNSDNSTYGIWYHEGSPDVMRFSASGNANSANADFAINALGDGTLSNRNQRIPHTGNTTGTVGNTDAPVYVDGGEIKVCTTYANASVNYATSAGSATSATSAGSAATLTTARKIWGNSFNGSADINGNLDWDNGTYRQRILITDDSTANTAVFTFQQSTDSGVNYGDLLTIQDNGNLTVHGGLGIANIANNTGKGISLYGGPHTGAPTYGIMFAGTGTFGTHGAVTSDWATYFTMSDTTNRGWIFRRGSVNVASIDGTGKLYLGYAANSNNPGIYWNPYVESTTDGSDASAIYQIKSGIAGGTELRISQANDTTDVINIVSPAYIYLNSKKAFQISDAWLRINDNGGFTNGVYFGTSVVRADGTIQSRTLQHINGNTYEDGKWYTNATGTANSGDNNATQGTLGQSFLQIGNAIARPAAGTAGGANNSKGYLYIYGSGTGAGELTYNDSMFQSNKSLYFSTNNNSGIANEVRGICGTNDYWRVAGGATASNSGYMEIATCDDGTEPIYVRQYTGVFGTVKRTLTLLDGSGNSSFPGTITAPEFMGDIRASKVIPTISKTYTDSNFYGTSDAEATCCKFFISVKPDGWYKPWQIRFKVRTYAPAHVNADSVTWCTLNGRADGLIYADWNERYDVGHYYIVVRALKNAGFNAGLGHAVGVNIRYSTGRGNSEYYKTIELEYYDCSGCTVTVLDEAVLWANWTSGTDANYNGWSNLDAVNRGLQESGDANDYTTIRSYYDRFTAGTNGIMRNSLIMQDSTGCWQSFTTTNGVETSKTQNTIGFIPGDIVYFSRSSNIAAGNFGSWNETTRFQSLIDYRYSSNVGNTLVGNKMAYIVFTVGTDNLFYLANPWMTTTLPSTEDGKVYVPLGVVYPDTNTYRCDFSGWHTPLQYINGAIRKYEVSHFNTVKTFDKGLEVTGHIAGDLGTTGHGLWSGGGYHNAYNNIILHGDATTGSSGIAFISDKVAANGTISTINQPSDRAFIQYHACGVTTFTNENVNPTLATSGEANQLIIGVGNDANDQVRIQTPSHTGLLHQIGNTGYVIPDTGNASGTLGNTLVPVYLDAGVFKTCTGYYATASPGFHNKVNAGNWAYMRLEFNTTDTKIWDIAANSSNLSGALEFRPNSAGGIGPVIKGDGTLTSRYFSVRHEATEKVTLVWNNTDSSLDFVFA